MQSRTAFFQLNGPTLWKITFMSASWFSALKRKST